MVFPLPLKNLIRLSKSSVFSGLISKGISIDESLESALRAEKKKSKKILFSEEEVEKIIESLFKENIHVTAFHDQNYPSDLKNIDNPPVLLYSKGNLSLLEKIKFAIVGARAASHESLRTAEKFATELAEFGFTIVSGFAYGVDTSACIGAAPFGTIQILGSGVNIIYPRQNQNLYYNVIEKNGLFVSEFPPNTPAKPENFPPRNRIISGLSKGILLVQASKKNGSSGSLITARLALQHGKDLFAIPGHPLDPKFEGGNNLIKYGNAIFTTTSQDIMDFLSYTLTPSRFNKFSTKISSEESMADKPEKSSFKHQKDAYQKILNILSTLPVSIEEISSFTGLSLKHVQIAIAEMEINNQIRRHTGGKFSISLL